MDIIASGRVGSGNLDSILLMDERDQLDCLRGALEFAGKLNGTIDLANKQLEEKHQNLKTDPGKMPSLIDTQENYDRKNIQHTSESKTDGISI